MATIGNVLLALLFPIAWGLVTAWAFERFGKRRRGKSSCEGPGR